MSINQIKIILIDIFKTQLNKFKKYLFHFTNILVFSKQDLLCIHKNHIESNFIRKQLQFNRIFSFLLFCYQIMYIVFYTLIKKYKIDVQLYFIAIKYYKIHTPTIIKPPVPKNMQKILNLINQKQQQSLLQLQKNIEQFDTSKIIHIMLESIGKQQKIAYQHMIQKIDKMDKKNIEIVFESVENKQQKGIKQLEDILQRKQEQYGYGNSYSYGYEYQEEKQQTNIQQVIYISPYQQTNKSQPQHEHQISQQPIYPQQPLYTQQQSYKQQPIYKQQFLYKKKQKSMLSQDRPIINNRIGYQQLTSTIKNNGQNVNNGLQIAQQIKSQQYHNKNQPQFQSPQPKRHITTNKNISMTQKIQLQNSPISQDQLYPKSIGKLTDPIKHKSKVYKIKKDSINKHSLKKQKQAENQLMANIQFLQNMRESAMLESSTKQWKQQINNTSNIRNTIKSIRESRKKHLEMLGFGQDSKQSKILQSKLGESALFSPQRSNFLPEIRQARKKGQLYKPAAFSVYTVQKDNQIFVNKPAS